MERWWTLPLAGGNGRSVPLGAIHSHSVAGLEGPPAVATWELGLGEREKEMGGKGEEREREVRPGLTDPGARRQMVLRQLDDLGQRRRAVALDPLGRSPW